MEAMIDYLSAGKLRHAKRKFDVTLRAVHASGITIFYFIRPHLEFIVFSMFYLYHTVGRSAITQAC